MLGFEKIRRIAEKKGIPIGKSSCVVSVRKKARKRRKAYDASSVLSAARVSWREEISLSRASWRKKKFSITKSQEEWSWASTLFSVFASASAPLRSSTLPILAFSDSAFASCLSTMEDCAAAT